MNSINRPPRQSVGCRLHCEQLEDRLTPAILTVTNAADVPVPGLFNLRERITQANNQVTNPGLDTIDFAPGLYTAGNLTLQVLSTLPTITDDLIIDGTAGRVTVEPANQPAQFRLFQVVTTAGPPRVNVTFMNLTVTGGNASNPADPNGGGIAMWDATVTLDNCDVSGNSALGNGGGLWADGNPSQLTLKNNSLVSHNHAGANGGGIAVTNTTLKVEQGTQVRNNTAGLGGGGIAAFANNYKGNGILDFVTLDGTNGLVQVNNNLALSGDGGGVLVQELNAGAAVPFVSFQHTDVNGNTAVGIAPAAGQPWTSGQGGGVALHGGLWVTADNATNVVGNWQSAPAPLLGVFLDPALVLDGFSGSANVVNNNQLP